MASTKLMKCVALLYTVCLLGPAPALAGYQPVLENRDAEETVTTTIYNCPTTVPTIAQIIPATTLISQVAVQPPSSNTNNVQLTTSTVYGTTVYTVTQCPKTITNCPVDSTVVVTKTIALYTTVCPVESQATSTPTSTGNGFSTFTFANSSSTSTIVSASACPSLLSGLGSHFVNYDAEVTFCSSVLGYNIAG
jgi:hypothetical protein